MPRVRIFEIGATFSREASAQPLRVGGLAFGAAVPEQWGAPARRRFLRRERRRRSPGSAARRCHERIDASLAPSRSQRGNPHRGTVGGLDRRAASTARSPLRLAVGATVFEVDLAALTRVPMPVAKPLSRLPSIRRDLAIMVKENMAVGAILEAIRETRHPSIEALDVFDVYHGDELPNGMKSVAILVLMRDTERTLTDADGDRIVASLLATLTARFGAILRSQAAR
jgi:phenylalanyl-tRNA synthetase beta chain